jgi:hypothetical protein
VSIENNILMAAGDMMAARLDEIEAETDKLRAENERLHYERDSAIVQLDITKKIATEKAGENVRLRAALALIRDNRGADDDCGACTWARDVAGKALESSSEEVEKP